MDEPKIIAAMLHCLLAKTLLARIPLFHAYDVRMKIVPYNRAAAVEYAAEWAYSRNPDFYDFSRLGGDCTSFASQCLFAGVGVMNYTPDLGWYYINQNNRAAAWSGVEYFYNFLIGNAKTPIGEGAGPFGEEVALPLLRQGDFVQLGNERGYYHTLVAVGFLDNGVPLMAAHSNDAFLKPLSAWTFQRLRCIHILAARSVEW